MSIVRSRMGVGIQPLVAGVLAAVVVLVAVVLLWTRYPTLGFFVSLGGQFVAVAGLYLFTRYRIYGHHKHLAAQLDGTAQGIESGPSGGVVGILVRGREADGDEDRRQQVTGSIFAFLVVAFLGFVALTFAGGRVAALVA